MSETYYEKFGVSPDADQSTIKRAWQQAVKEKHPDKNDDPNAQQQFIQLKEAYDVLSDKTEREIYDRLTHEQYIGDRQHGSSKETTDAYQRDRKEQKQRSTGSSSRTDSGVNWKANTRNHEAAEYVWNPESGPTADTAPPATTADAGVIKRVVAYSACISIPSILSVFVLGAWTSGIPEYGIEKGLSVGSIGITILAAIVFWTTVAGSEWLLDTDRRLWSPF